MLFKAIDETEHLHELYFMVQVRNQRNVVALRDFTSIIVK